MRTVFANSLDYWATARWALDAVAAEVRNLHGLEIVIENPQYSMREGKGWMSAAPADYGFIVGTTGADGDEVDCYVLESQSKQVFIVDQNKINSQDFDEHKVIFGATSIDEARQLYIDGHTDGEKIFRAITPVSLDKLKLWLRSNDHSEPFSD